MSIKVDRLKLIECIEKFRKTKLAELAQARKDEISHEKQMKAWDKARKDFCLAILTKRESSRAKIESVWGDESSLEISITCKVEKKAVSDLLIEPPKKNKRPETIEREITAAEDQLAWLKISTQKEINISSKMDEQNLGPYIKFVPAN